MFSKERLNTSVSEANNFYGDSYVAYIIRRNRTSLGLRYHSEEFVMHSIAIGINLDKFRSEILTKLSRTDELNSKETRCKKPY
ncbi:hypothetical protein GCM10007199_39290 [Fictibacillus barbaricus]|nr:hypothetical protein GCM10007199_39290 [Fictibacillus barbaricus]